MHLKMSSGKWQPSCLGLNVLTPSVHMWAVGGHYHVEGHNGLLHVGDFNSLRPSDAYMRR